MPKYIVRPNQRVSHGAEEDARAHFSKMVPGQSFAAFPSPPVHDFYEGDEIELTEDQAAAMEHAVCTPEEFEQQSSPKAFMAKGYTRDEAESMAASLKEGMDARKKQRSARASRAALPGGGNAPTDGSTDVNPRTVAKFPDDKKPSR